MKIQEKVRPLLAAEIALLDDFVFIPENDAANKSGKFSIDKKVWKRMNADGEWGYFDRLPNYFEDRDAIIPVIQKQRKNFNRIQWFKFRETLAELFYGNKDEHNQWYDIQDMAMLFSSAEQLCITFLQIAGVWAKFDEKDLVEPA